MNIYQILALCHGNPKKYHPIDVNESTMNKTFGELYQSTIDRLQKIHDSGYDVYYIWESCWKQYKKNHPMSEVCSGVIKFENNSKELSHLYTN